MIRRLLVPTLLLAGFLTGCQTVETTAPGAVGVDRKQRMLVSEEEVQKAAAQAYSQLVADAQAKDRLNKDSAMVSRVKNITQRLIPHTATFRQDATGWPWEVNVLQSDDINAFAMPGGKIAVFSGIIQKLNLTDAELAAIIGHEISHALREHSRERISRAYAQQIALAGVGAVAGVGEGTMQLADMVASVTFQLPHSREQEREADRIGLELAARGGYDPNAAVTLWEKMIAESKGSPPEFLSTHPDPEERIEELRALVPKVLPLYRVASKG
jgi:predicted Zn-dependent protease